MSTPAAALGGSSFRVRRVPFPPHTRPRPVLMQNENGPCPLLAVVNTLLLRGQLNVGAECAEVSEAALLQTLANRALEREMERDRGHREGRAAAPAAAAAAATAAVGEAAAARAAARAVLRANKEWQVEELMELLPSLASGLDVNLRFNRCVFTGFEMRSIPSVTVA